MESTDVIMICVCKRMIRFHEELNHVLTVLGACNGRKLPIVALDQADTDGRGEELATPLRRLDVAPQYANARGDVIEGLLQVVQRIARRSERSDAGRGDGDGHRTRPPVG